LLTAPYSSGARKKSHFKISPVQIGVECVEPRRLNVAVLFVTNTASNISGLTPAASTKAVAPSSPSLLIPCITGTPNQLCAMHILRTSTIPKEESQFEKVDGLPEAGLYKS
jgi:hypothetical protein